MTSQTEPIVLSLFDQSGNMVRPWAEAGYECVCVDIENDSTDRELFRPEPGDSGWGGSISYVQADVTEWLPPRRDYAMVFAFPPCTNLAVSGARWFKDKGLSGLSDAIELVERARYIAEWSGSPWMIENPVSTLSTYWRKPDYTFHPYEYDGFTDKDDRYSKKTCLWTSDFFTMPETDAAEEYDDRIHKMPPSEERSRKRAETPMGFARAVYEANGGDDG